MPSQKVQSIFIWEYPCTLRNLFYFQSKVRRLGTYFNMNINVWFISLFASWNNGIDTIINWPGELYTWFNFQPRLIVAILWNAPPTEFDSDNDVQWDWLRNRSVMACWVYAEFLLSVHHFRGGWDWSISSLHNLEFDQYNTKITRACFFQWCHSALLNSFEKWTLWRHASDI